MRKLGEEADAEAGEEDKDTLGAASKSYHAVGQLTLTSVKSFVVTGAHATAMNGYFNSGNVMPSSLVSFVFKDLFNINSSSLVSKK